MKGVTYDAERDLLFHNVSIHTPNEGSDKEEVLKLIEGASAEFQSTLPMKGVTMEFVSRRDKL